MTEAATAELWHQETLIVPCPACGDTLVRSICNPSLFAFSIPSPVVRSESIECRDCGHRYDMPDGRAKTSERIYRGDAPLRDVVGIERGIDGEGMCLHHGIELGLPQGQATFPGLLPYGAGRQSAREGCAAPGLPWQQERRGDRWAAAGELAQSQPQVQRISPQYPFSTMVSWRYYKATMVKGCRMSERWRAVVGYEGIYEVSDQGRVRGVGRVSRTVEDRGDGAKNWKVMALNIRNGYPCVHLWKERTRRCFGVHILVMAAFVGPRPEGHDINHKDAHRANNYLENLEYVTHRENMRHAVDMGLYHPFTWATEERVEAVIELGNRGLSARAIALHFGCSATPILKILRAAGFILVSNRDKKKERRMIPCACGCGRLRVNFGHDGTPRRFVSGHNRRKRPWATVGT